jgi:hypothetical protein
MIIYDLHVACLTVLQYTAKELGQLLGRWLVPDAAHTHLGARTRCLPGTREPVIEKIMTWIDGDDDRAICWFYGPAGFGKSAIAQTVAERCAETGKLAASFFFTRGAGDRARMTGFISTLSYQLTVSVPETKRPIETVLQRDHTIPHQSLENQLQKLIIDPVRLVSPPIHRMAIIIDAVDECNDRGDIAEFIEIIVRASQNHRLPFRFLVTGRAENHIQEKFAPPESVSATYNLALHEFDAQVDIRAFLEFHFSRILKEKPRLMQGIQRPWPSAENIDALVKKSSGLFIFASTLVNFVTDGTAAPQRKLETVLNTLLGLDPLYAEVFNAACRVDPFDRVIGSIMILREQLFIFDLSCLLQLPTEDILHAVLGIQSIFRIPEDNDKPIELIHASPRDFLMDERRSKCYFINPPARHASIAVHCLKLLTEDAKHQKFAKSGAALYACLNWCHHIDGSLMEDGGDVLFDADLTRCLQDFKSRALDHWVNTLILEAAPGRIKAALTKIILRLKACYQDLFLLNCDILTSFFYVGIAQPAEKSFADPQRY